MTKKISPITYSQMAAKMFFLCHFPLIPTATPTDRACGHKFPLKRTHTHTHFHPEPSERKKNSFYFAFSMSSSNNEEK
jgi:hypothetical protein